MKITNIPLSAIRAAEWNPNYMDQEMLARLRRSIEKFGLLIPLVVREISEGQFETVGGAQRLAVLTELGMETAPCVVVTADDADARLLAQALNRISGEDDPTLKAAAMRQVLNRYGAEELLALLPETAASLSAVTSASIETLADHLASWNKDRGRLKHMTLQLTPGQVKTVGEAIKAAEKEAAEDPTSPNRRGTVFAHICESYLASRQLRDRPTGQERPK